MASLYASIRRAPFISLQPRFRCAFTTEVIMQKSHIGEYPLEIWPLKSKMRRENPRIIQCGEQYVHLVHTKHPRPQR